MTMLVLAALVYAERQFVIWSVYFFVKILSTSLITARPVYIGPIDSKDNYAISKYIARNVGIPLSISLVRAKTPTLTQHI